MQAQQDLGHPGPSARRGPQETPEVRHDQQPAVGPAAPLDEQGAEVRRRGAKGHPLRIVVELPASPPQVDRGFGVLDHGTVVDEYATLEAALVPHLGNLLQRGLPYHRVCTDPERRTEVREALMHLILDVGGGAGHALEHAWRAGKGAVGRLDDRDSAMLAPRQTVCESQNVLRMHDRVGIQNNYIVTVVKGEPPLVGAGALQQEPGPVGSLTKASAHQCDVRVDIHRLVRLVREIRVPLALERTHGDLEAAREAPIGTSQEALIDRLTFGITQKVSRPLSIPTALAEQGDLDEYPVGMIDDAVAARLAREPRGDFLIQAGELASLARKSEPNCVCSLLKGRGGGRHASVHRRKATLDGIGELAHLAQGSGVLVCRRNGRVIDEEPDGASWIVLQSRRKDRLPDERRIFLV